MNKNVYFGAKTTFFKYHSLGNDFILLDWLDQPHPPLATLVGDKEWQTWVKNTCHRNFGIGADGILIITKGERSGSPEVWIFNQDGSNGQTCLNGARCIVDYLHQYRGYPESFSLHMGPNLMTCTIDDQLLITTDIPYSKYCGPVTVTVKGKEFAGHTADVGNPHFIVFDTANPEILTTYGSALEHAEVFPAGTNVSFVEMLTPHEYRMLIHERGCGPTLACGSAGAAVLRTLFELKKIKQNDRIALHMPGGTLYGFVTDQNRICLQASATLVFKGSL